MANRKLHSLLPPHLKSVQNGDDDPRTKAFTFQFQHARRDMDSMASGSLPTQSQHVSKETELVAVGMDVDDPSVDGNAQAEISRKRQRESSLLREIDYDDEISLARKRRRLLDRSNWLAVPSRHSSSSHPDSEQIERSSLSETSYNDTFAFHAPSRAAPMQTDPNQSILSLSSAKPASDESSSLIFTPTTNGRMLDMSSPSNMGLRRFVHSTPSKKRPADVRPPSPSLSTSWVSNVSSEQEVRDSFLQDYDETDMSKYQSVEGVSSSPPRQPSVDILTHSSLDPPPITSLSSISSFEVQGPDEDWIDSSFSIEPDFSSRLTLHASPPSPPPPNEFPRYLELEEEDTFPLRFDYHVHPRVFELWPATFVNMDKWEQQAERTSPVLQDIRRRFRERYEVPDPGDDDARSEELFDIAEVSDIDEMGLGEGEMEMEQLKTSSSPFIASSFKSGKGISGNSLFPLLTLFPAT
ncbi:hypothetical protein BT69DRAFT_1285138 [Atractiella rhizophila]|nr:hypothetical protein BT69DRAFT_1285138 [Atractiella rhizophila]